MCRPWLASVTVGVDLLVNWEILKDPFFKDFPLASVRNQTRTRCPRIKWAVGRKTKCGGRCVKRGIRPWSIGISIVNRIVSGLLIEVSGVSVIAALSWKGHFVSLCLSWAQQLPSSYLYYFALDLHSKFVAILQDSTGSAIWQIVNLRNMSAVHNIFLFKRYHNTLYFCCVDNKNSIFCTSFCTANLLLATYFHFCIHMLENALATNWNDHFQNQRYIGN